MHDHKRSVPFELSGKPRCNFGPSLVSAHPELAAKIRKELEQLRAGAAAIVGPQLRVGRRPRVGFDDGLIYPGNEFRLGTSAREARSAAAARAPLRGTVRVIVVLADFTDKAMAQTRQHYLDLFFSTGVIATGSVREYFTEVSNGLVDIVGDVVGPYRLPRTLADYAHGESGTGDVSPNARTMAYDAAVAANADVDFGPYDNDQNGYVDAFIVVHAGPGAEVTGSAGDIWSHKWTLEGGAYDADGTKIYAYLTVPEDAKVGVCCHELGHLLFGFPDLYDTDNSSEGIGNWCLMAGGSWNGNGDIPAHPSAWCKAQQEWVTVQAPTSNVQVNVEDVKTSHTVYRLWKDGGASTEYFLLENRQRTLFDRNLPGDGLLVWHVDEAIGSNSDEAHYKVALEQADAREDLEAGNNRGDGGDPYPGTSGNTSFHATSTPNSKSYGGVSTCVAITNIPASAAIMPVRLAVRCVKPKEKKEFKEKDLKDVKEKKEFKEKDLKDLKERKEFKEKDLKEVKERKEFKEKDLKEVKEFKELEKPNKEVDKRKDAEKPADRPGGGLGARGAESLEHRVAELEGRLAAIEPFIPAELRPDLSESALCDEEDLQAGEREMRQRTAVAKRMFDTPPRG